MTQRLVLVLILLIASLGAICANDSIAPPEEVFELRAFHASEIEALKNDTALDYDRDQRRLPTPWERFKAWLAEMLERFLGDRVGGYITENVLYILVVVILAFAIIVLSRGGLRRVFHGAPRSLAEVVTVEEDIREMDLGTLIAEAEKSGDLRRAIRLHYLLVLRKLVDRGILNWSPDRTDRDYMAQINEPALRSRFTHVALVFQWVWYGHGEVDAQRYAELRKPFVEFETEPVV